MPQLLSQDVEDRQSDEHESRTAAVRSQNRSHVEPSVDFDEILDQPLLVAGQRVAPGTYRRIESSFMIQLGSEDFLPASLDGKVAHYILVRSS